MKHIKLINEHIKEIYIITFYSNLTRFQDKFTKDLFRIYYEDMDLGMFNEMFELLKGRSFIYQAPNVYPGMGSAVGNLKSIRIQKTMAESSFGTINGNCVVFKAPCNPVISLKIVGIEVEVINEDETVNTKQLIVCQPPRVETRDLPTTKLL